MSEKLEYLKKLELQIQEAEEVLIQRKAKREKFRQQLQHEEIDRLEEHLANAKIRLKDLSTLAEESWQDFKQIIEDTLESLRESLKKL